MKCEIMKNPLIVYFERRVIIFCNYINLINPAWYEVIFVKQHDIRIAKFFCIPFTSSAHRHRPTNFLSTRGPSTDRLPMVAGAQSSPSASVHRRQTTPWSFRPTRSGTAPTESTSPCRHPPVWIVQLLRRPT